MKGSDGADTIAWLLKHPACNGRIGMYGFSYQGATQLLAAAEQPEGLKCIAPHMTARDLYRGWFYHQGALRLSSALGWGIQMLREDARRLGLREASRQARSRVGQHPGTGLACCPTPSIQPLPIRNCRPMCATGSLIARKAPTGPISTSAPASIEIQVPALHIAGWFDTYLEGSIAGYLALRNHAGSEFARANQYLIAGPWVHIPWGDRAGDANLGDAANLDTGTILLRWFNHWLKDSGDFSPRASRSPLRSWPE